MLEEVLRRYAYLKSMDDVADLDDFLIRSQDGFTAYASKFNAFEQNPDTGKWRPVKMPARWRESPDRIELFAPVYEPGLPTPICEIDGELYFNLWRGFIADPREGDVSFLTKTVDHVFEGMPEEKAHFYKFHAYARQHPGRKIMHAMMLISRVQGLGKSLIGEIVGYGVWGERNFSEVEHQHLGATFNQFLKHRKFILGNEMLLSTATNVDKRKDANVLKNAITRDRVEINEKMIRQYYVRDVLYWMLTSNFDDAVWLDRVDDRRLHISRLKQEVPLSQKFHSGFGAEAKAWAKTKEAAMALNYFFLHYDCSDFDPAAPPPVTEGQKITFEMGLTTLDKFIRDLAEDPSLLTGSLHSDFVRLDQVREKFMSLYKDVNMPMPSDAVIGSAISRFGGVHIPEKIQWTDNTGARHEVRVWALRNAQYWLKAGKQNRANHYCSPKTSPGPNKYQP